MTLTSLFKGTGPSGYGWSTTAEEIAEGVDLTGKTILITGCNSGLGLETMRVLAERGATVVAAARTREKAQVAGEQVDGTTHPVACELSDPQSVTRCCAEVSAQTDRLDAIICNAGIMALPKRETIHGYEKQFFVNHVGHFILVDGLMNHLTDDARVIAVSSDAHKMAPSDGIQFDDLAAEGWYSAWKAYGHSKLANVLFARELGRRFKEDDTNRSAMAVHPGPIDTNLTRNMNAFFQACWSFASPLFLKTTPQGAATQTWAVVHPEPHELNGKYLADCNIAETSEHGADIEMAEKLWETTEQIVDELDATPADQAAS